MISLTDQRDTVPDSNGPQSVTYTVLFYKTKNKVHKARGASKYDGTLFIGPPPQARATLKDEGGSIIFQTSNCSDLAKKGAAELLDETISMGGYQVEILSLEGKSVASTPMSAPKSNITKPTRNIIASRPLMGNSVRVPLGLQSKKRSFLDRKIPQPQSKLKTLNPQPFKKQKQNQDSSSMVSSNAVILTSDGSAPPRKPLPTFQRPRKLGQIKLQRPIQGAKRGSATPASAAIGPQSENLFPNAVGNLIVPVSIKRELRPHQITGISFLWNAINGHSKVEQASPHLHDAAPKGVGGCILADEMGLGKSLMTIATICALQKQSRDSRFVVVCPSSLVKNWAGMCLKNRAF